MSTPKFSLSWLCRVFTASAILKVTLDYISTKNFYTTVTLYLLIYVLSFFVVWKKDFFDFKTKKTQISPVFTVLCVSLVLIFSIILSFVLPTQTTVTKINTLSVVSILILAPVFEELFFRRALISFDKPILTSVISSLIFAFFHPYGAFIHALILGLLLSLFYVSSKKLYVSVACHFSNNLLALICLWRDVRAEVLCVCVVVAVTIILLSKKGKKEEVI